MSARKVNPAGVGSIVAGVPVVVLSVVCVIIVEPPKGVSEPGAGIGAAIALGVVGTIAAVIGLIGVVLALFGLRPPPRWQAATGLILILGGPLLCLAWEGLEMALNSMR